MRERLLVWLYTGGADDLYDPEWSYGEVPWVLGRRRFDRITIANSDAAATSLTHAAIDQALRAVTEFLTDVVRPEFLYPWGGAGNAPLPRGDFPPSWKRVMPVTG